MIKFFEESHKYVSIHGEVYTSVTSFIKKFEADKDWDAILKKYAKKHKKTPEEVRKAWDLERDKSIRRGNAYHKAQEDILTSVDCLYVDEHELSIFKPDIQDGVKHSLNQKIDSGVYPEFLIFSEEYSLAGQADYVEVVGNTLNIKDYKTNKKIDTEAYKSWDGKTEKLLAPFNKLDACNFNIYSIQLNVYAYLILRNNPKKRLGTMEILHIQFDDNDKQVGITKYKVPNLQKEVKIALNALKK
jgi:hypothetical protein